MGDVTRLLERWGRGDRGALKELMPLVYGELHRLAHRYLRNERTGHTLQPTALVNEAYLRLAGVREMRVENRTHFYGAAANVMRRVLVDYARQKKAVKRGGDDPPILPLDDAVDVAVDMHLDMVALDEALTRLAAISPVRAQVVELRYFGGLSVEETAAYLGISPATVKRHWSFARAWLFRALGGVGDPA